MTYIDRLPTVLDRPTWIWWFLSIWFLSIWFLSIWFLSWLVLNVVIGFDRKGYALLPFEFLFRVFGNLRGDYTAEPVLRAYFLGEVRKRNTTEYVYLEDDFVISFNRKPGDKGIEFGGGANPKLVPQCLGGVDVCVDVRMCQDGEGRQVTDFTIDLNETFQDKISSNEFDFALAVFVLEHISWRKVPQFLSECLRVLKSSGKAVFVIPNTENQMKYILSKPEWDGDEGSMIFGDLDYPENSHRAAFSPRSIVKLLQEAGFENIRVSPYGPELGELKLQTDMVVEAFKPLQMDSVGVESMQTVQTLPDASQTFLEASEIEASTSITVSPPVYDPVALFDRDYFNGGRKVGGYVPFYWDDPRNEIIARHVLARKPISVLELGAGRGYVLKRLEDAGIGQLVGLEISNSCHLTRATDRLVRKNVMEQWDNDHYSYDLCFSFAFLEHVPERYLDLVIEQMSTSCSRGLHGITLIGQDDGSDKTRVTIRTREWWQAKLPRGHEVFSLDELRGGPLPEDYVKGDGKVKLNLGCVAPETLIHTLHGYKPISDMIPGELVLTHKGRYRRVLKISERPYQGKIHKLKVLGLGTLLITPEHPVYVVPDLITNRGNVRLVEKKPLEWVDAKDVRSGHFTFYPHEVERLSSVRQEVAELFESVHAPCRFKVGRRGHKVPRLIDRSLCRLFGYFLAEGCALKDSVSYAFHTKETRYINDVRKLGLDVFGTTAYERSKRRNAHELVFCNKKMSALFQEMGGKYAHGKKMADSILTLPANFQREILIGAFRGDGSVSHRGLVSYSTVSSDLASQMKFLLYRQGIPARVTKGKKSPNSTIDGRKIEAVHDPYCVSPQHSEESVNLYREIYPDKEFSLLARPSTRVLPNGTYGYVREVEELDYDGMVWNLEIEEDNTYVTEIGVVHNCVMTQFHNGWTNMDVLDMSQFAGQWGYRFQGFDAKVGLPMFNTGTVDMIFSSHMHEHLTYKEGLSFLRECRRVIKPDGWMRIIVPDAWKLIQEYAGEKFNLSKEYEGGGDLPMFGDMNEDCANAPTSAARLWSLGGDHHHALYDMETLCHYLREAGWEPRPAAFRQSENKQMLRETLDMLPAISLYVDCVPQRR